MAVVKKLSLGIQGITTEVKISLDKKNGIFTHDLPSDMLKAVNISNRQAPYTQLRDVKDAVHQIVKAYNEMTSIEEFIIICNVQIGGYNASRSESKSVTLQFAHVRKVTIGNKSEYFDMFFDTRTNEWVKLGNKFYTGYSKDALKPSDATHIPFTQENYDKLVAIKNALDKLGNQLTDMLSQDNIIPALATMNTNLLLSPPTDEEKSTL